ncbi:unnamed protein product [Trifolium pratense]|uniref:Uncharacterized protein n=1 Tax=Trifolium pratense TaxID=57577 RepID=A0ACB0L9H3_TRIPR|nr:unnamed protein product [Trifolium pratense]
MCRTNDDCRYLPCIDEISGEISGEIPACGFPFHVTGSEGFGICGCYEKVPSTLHKISGL